MRPRAIFRLITFLVLLCLGDHAHGESVVLEEIVVRGREVIANEETLTIREVRESSARDIGEALKLVPGVSCVSKGAIANDIVLRGFQRDNINVFLDGVRLHGGCPSRMDPPSFHFDFAEVDYIEIIKGPYDVRHPGSLGGVINAVSKSPDPGPGFSADLTYGSYDLVNAATTASYGAESFDALAGYAYKYSLPPKSGDGKRITDIYPVTSPNRYRPEDIDSRAYAINTFWTKGEVKLSDDARSELGYSYQDADHILYPYIYLVDVADPDGPAIGTLPAARTYQNVEARLWGGELSAQLALPLDLYLRGVLSYTEGKNEDSGEPLVEIPPLQGNVSLRYDRDTFFAEITERFADRQNRVDNTLNEEETAGWAVTDVKAGVNWRRWSIYAGVNNVFDKFYFTHLSYQRDPFRTGEKVPETGAFGYLTASYRY